jgi:hypothetical protein
VIDLRAIAEKAGIGQRRGHCEEAQRRGWVPSWPGHLNGVQIPPPDAIPANIALHDLIDTLSLVYWQACVWSGMVEQQRRQFYWQARASLQKDENNLGRRMRVALRELHDSGSNLNIAIYTWWKVQRLTESGKNVTAFNVWRPDDITNKQHRAWFYRDCGEIVRSHRPMLWPAATDQALEILRRWKTHDSVCSSPDEAAEWWDALYVDDWEDAVERFSRQRAIIAAKIENAYYKNHDIGLWLAVDLAEHLKLKGIVSTNIG